MAGRCSMAAIALAIAVTATHGPRSAAQSPKTLPFHVPTAVNVERVLDLKYGANQSGNAARINAGLLASASTYRGPWCFNGGGTIDSGLLWITDGTVGEVQPRLRFDGDLFTATATANSDTITVTGWPVEAGDVGRRIKVLGGTGWITNNPNAFYTVQSVNVGAGTWTLDRECSGAGGATALVAVVDPPIASRMPQRSGRVFAGPGGRGIISNASATTHGGTFRVVQITPIATFDGMSVTATAPSASNVLTLSGWNVTSADRGRTLQITGGTGFIAGYYFVVATQGTNTWKLDRVCTNASASGLVGTATKTLWTDPGLGSVYSGIQFQGHAFPDNPSLVNVRQHVGLRLEAALVDEDIETGKHTISHCTFNNFGSAILAGWQLNKAYDSTAPDFVGENFAHADLLMSIKNGFRWCRSGIHSRTEQAAHFTSLHDDFSNVENCYYMERTGDGVIINPHVSGDNSTLLRIGKPPGRHGWTILGGSIDAGGTTDHFQLVKVDSNVTTTYAIQINGFLIKDGNALGGSPAGSRPLCDVTSGCQLSLVNIQRLFPNCLKFTPSTDNKAIPAALLSGCILENTPTLQFTDPQSQSEVAEKLNRLLNDSAPSGSYIRAECCRAFKSDGSIVAFSGEYRVP